jgi:class 3 adenylate cyclase/tetratricopeptide (TPR) repeat protein
MSCAKCGAENREGAKFCKECAAPILAKCSRCGAASQPGSKFCDECAAPLTATPPPSDHTRPLISVMPDGGAAPSTDGERKTVTVLFADIKGSMELMEDIDPEEARAIVDPAINLMINAAHRYDGFIVQSTGDGIFAIFGAPTADEDHPQRALYAALRMQEDVKCYADKLRSEKGVNLQIRVGVNTGEVVVRSIRTDDSHVEYTPIGHSISLASRLQTLAAPGSIAIGGSMGKLVEGYFTLKPMGPARIKGVSEPVIICEVTGLGPLRSRIQRSARHGFTKFVGRQRELTTMNDAAELARWGHGRIVEVMAEAGVGKSRLLLELKSAMSPEASSVSHGKVSPYLPLIEVLHRYFGIGAGDSQEIRREKVTGVVVALDRSLEETLPYLFRILGLVEGNDSLGLMEVQVRRRRTLEAVKRILMAASIAQPLIIIFEDLHWIDKETEAFLTLFAEAIGNARILLLVSYRPEYHHDWGGKTYRTQLVLEPLGPESADEMLTSLLGDNPELTPLKKLIVERADGNPFFIEEMVLALLEQGTLTRDGATKLARPVAELRIPATVQAVLAARIDRLPVAEKELLQTLSVIGRAFSRSLVREVLNPQARLEPSRSSRHEAGFASTGSSEPPSDGVTSELLERMLADLQVAEFIYEHPGGGDVEYIFKHALTQEVAYNSILMERRKLIHRKTGEAIESKFVNQLEDNIEKLIYHYSHSGDASKTARYMTLAAEKALRRSDYSDAIEHADAGLRIVATLPEASERDEFELALQIWRAEAIDKSSPQLADPAVLVAYSRARSLCSKVGTTTQAIRVLWGMQQFYQVRGEPRTAREFSEELVVVAERGGDPQQIMAVRSRFGHMLSFLGEFARARPLLEEAATHLDPNFRLFGDDKTYALLMLGRVLWFLGFPTAAARRNEEAIESSHSGIRMPYNLVMPASISILLGNPTRAMQLARELEEFSSVHEAPYFRDHAQRLLGAALIEDGQIEKGLSLIDPYLAHGRLKTSHKLEYWHFIVPAAYAYGRCGRTDYALQLIDEALSASAASGQAMFDAEYQRTKGDLLLMDVTRDATAAESSLRQAIKTARAQSAKTPELRATTSLAALLNCQGRCDEARGMLSEIYGWFTEGFETTDLKDAKRLLDELSGSAR